MLGVLVLFFLLVQNACSSNILYVSSVPFPSYHMWNQVLAFELVERGHNVTFLRTHRSETMKKANYTEIMIEGVHDVVNSNTENRLFDWIGIQGKPFSPTRFITDMKNMCLLLCRTSAKSTGLSYLLNTYRNFKFDLIIFDVTASTCFYPLIEIYDYPPAIGVTQFLLPSYVAFSFGNQLNPAYIPWHRGIYDNEMTFFDRASNFIYTYLEIRKRYTQQYKQEHEIARMIFGNHIPSMEALERHISLLFSNIDPILNHAQPVAPNIIPIAGLHLREPKKLPQDLQNLLDGAENGAIVFSLGSILQWTELSRQIRKNLLYAFSQIQETVLWKFDGEIEDVPKNVIVRKWLPQSDVLGHPNVKLFIGHGGALSTQEALYHGVPMICIPFYADQHHTAKMIVERKFGLSLSLHEIEANLVLQNLEEALRNPLYSKNMKRASRMFRSRNETPLERAMFWVEYLLEYGDVDFLSTTARDLPFYKSSGLDVLIFLVAVLVFLFVLLCKLVLFTLAVLNPRKKTKLN